MEKTGTTTWLPSDLIDLIDRAKEARMDIRRGDTIRFLLLVGLAEVGLLDEQQRRALLLDREDTTQEDAGS